MDGQMDSQMDSDEVKKPYNFNRNFNIQKIISFVVGIFVIVGGWYSAMNGEFLALPEILVGIMNLLQFIDVCYHQEKHNLDEAVRKLKQL